MWVRKKIKILRCFFLTSQNLESTLLFFLLVDLSLSVLFLNYTMCFSSHIDVTGKPLSKFMMTSSIQRLLTNQIFGINKHNEANEKYSKTGEEL